MDTWAAAPRRGIGDAGDMGFGLAIAAGTVAAGAVVAVAGHRSPAICVLLLLALASVVVLVRKPGVIAPAAVVLLYTNAPVVAVTYHGVPSPVHVIVPALLAVPLVRGLRAGRRLVANRPFAWLLGLLAVDGVSTVFAVHPGPGLSETVQLAGEGVLLYLLVLNVIRTPAELRHVVWALVGAGVLLAAVTVVQNLTHTYDHPWLGLSALDHDYLSGRTTSARAAGPVADPNYYAQILLPPLALAWMLALRETRRLARWAGGLSAALLAVAIGFTYSRGAAVAVVVLLLVMMAYRYVRFRHVAIAMVAAGVLLVAMPAYRDRIGTLSSITGATAATGSSGAADDSTRARATENLAAAMAFRDHPLLGLGPRGFPLAYQGYADKIGIEVHEASLHGADAGEAPTRAAHDIFLGLAAEIGLIGLAVFLGVVLTTMRPLSRTRRDPRAAQVGVQHLAAGLFLGLVAYLAAGVFLSLAFERFFWLLLALAGAAVRVVASPEREIRAP